MSDGELLLTIGALLACGLAVSLLAGRLRVPGLVLVLGLGMLLGSDGVGAIDFNDYELAQTVGIVGLTLILFEGGLTAGWSEIRPVIGPAVSLAILGTLGTALGTGFVASVLFDFTLLEGLLLGSILAATDSAAIFAVLRGSTLRRRVARTLEGESGLNDPVAVLLVVGFGEWITHEGFGVEDMALEFVIELGIGLAAGLAVGFGSVWVLRTVKLASAGLYPVASVAIVALAYGIGDTLHGSGFLAVYVTGLIVGSVRTPALRTMATFHDGLAWVAQLVMFLVLGLLVFPSQLGGVLVEGAVLAVVAAAVARPLAAILATQGMNFRIEEQLVLGWAGLRGAVPVVLATFPVTAGVPGSVEFFNIVFFAVLLSTVLQGATFEGFARRLRVTTHEAALPAPLIEGDAIRRLGAEVVEFPVRSTDAAAGRRVRDLNMPRDALLNIIVRGERAIPPRGSMRVEAGDRLHVLVRQEAAMDFRELLKVWRDGPLEEPRRVERRPRSSPTIFSTRPWDTEIGGDPSRPQQVSGVDVVERLRTRRDHPGALVLLDDGRLACTGELLAVGSASQLQDWARRQLARASEDSEQAWWREVIGALASG